jgi:hypothetical protein
VSEQGHTLVDIREAIRSLERRMDARFEGVDHRFGGIDRWFEGMARRFDVIDSRIDALDDKVSRQFVWLVGLQVTTLVAIVSALVMRS